MQIKLKLNLLTLIGTIHFIVSLTSLLYYGCSFKYDCVNFELPTISEVAAKREVYQA